MLYSILAFDLADVHPIHAAARALDAPRVGVPNTQL